MKDMIDIYKNFKGYGGYPLREAEKIIRSRILTEFTNLIRLLEGCEEKTRNMRMIKILQHIIALKSRMNRMEKQIHERDELFVPAYLKAHISHIDEEKLKKIDFRLAELIIKSKEIIDSLSCAETDTRIIEKFTRINEHLRNIEKNCHQRALVLKREII